MADIDSVTVGREVERWRKYYSSYHSILLVGEGDFSFSVCLAKAFGSAKNIVATSLDSYDQLIEKYKKAEANLKHLKILGATLLHGVDATNMESVLDLQSRKFRMIIYNFPHSGFHSKENDPTLIGMHRSLVRGFFRNAKGMLMLDGEIHVTHKVTSPYNEWKIEDLASECALFLVECPVFTIKDYPGYANKRGAGSRCDEPFQLGACRTFKFKLFPAAEKIPEQRNLDVIPKSRSKFRAVPILKQHRTPPVERLYPSESDYVPLSVGQPPYLTISTECHMVFSHYLNEVEETFGGIINAHALYETVCEAVNTGFKTYMCSVPGSTSSGYIDILEELRGLSILRSEWLRQVLASTC